MDKGDTFERAGAVGPWQGRRPTPALPLMSRDSRYAAGRLDALVNHRGRLAQALGASPRRTGVSPQRPSFTALKGRHLPEEPGGIVSIQRLRTWATTPGSGGVSRAGNVWRLAAQADPRAAELAGDGAYAGQRRNL